MTIAAKFFLRLKCIEYILSIEDTLLIKEVLALWALNLEFEIGRLKFKVPPVLKAKERDGRHVPAEEAAM